MIKIKKNIKIFNLSVILSYTIFCSTVSATKLNNTYANIPQIQEKAHHIDDYRESFYVQNQVYKKPKITDRIYQKYKNRDNMENNHTYANINNYADINTQNRYDNPYYEPQKKIKEIEINFKDYRNNLNNNNKHETKDNNAYKNIYKRKRIPDIKNTTVIYDHKDINEFNNPLNTQANILNSSNILDFNINLEDIKEENENNVTDYRHMNNNIFDNEASFNINNMSNINNISNINKINESNFIDYSTIKEFPPNRKTIYHNSNYSNGGIMEFNPYQSYKTFLGNSNNIPENLNEKKENSNFSNLRNNNVLKIMYKKRQEENLRNAKAKNRKISENVIKHDHQFGDYIKRRSDEYLDLMLSRYESKDQEEEKNEGKNLIIDTKKINVKNIQNKNIQNKDIHNENMQNKDIQNENIQNKDIHNENIQNKDIQNENIQKEPIEISKYTILETLKMMKKSKENKNKINDKKSIEENKKTQKNKNKNEQISSENKNKKQTQKEKNTFTRKNNLKIPITLHKNKNIEIKKNSKKTNINNAKETQVFKKIKVLKKKGVKDINIKDINIKDTNNKEIVRKKYIAPVEYKNKVNNEKNIDKNEKARKRLLEKTKKEEELRKTKTITKIEQIQLENEKKKQTQEEMNAFLRKNILKKLIAEQKNKDMKINNENKKNNIENAAAKRPNELSTFLKLFKIYDIGKNNKENDNSKNSSSESTDTRNEREKKNEKKSSKKANLIKKNKYSNPTANTEKSKIKNKK